MCNSYAAPSNEISHQATGDRRIPKRSEVSEIVTNDDSDKTQVNPGVNQVRNTSASTRRAPFITKSGFTKTHVNHSYHDFSRQPFVTSVTNQNRRGSSHPFPEVLHFLLEQADIANISDIVSWQHHGRAFHVHDQEKFKSIVMPKHFRQTRFTSFQRQLSLYGFLRLTRKGPDQNAYYHELCLRGRPDLAKLISRTRVNGHWVRQATSPDSEPDFLSMPKVEESQKVQASEYTSDHCATPHDQIGCLTIDHNLELQPNHDLSAAKLMDFEPLPFPGNHGPSMSTKDRIEILDFLSGIDLATDNASGNPATNKRIAACNDTIQNFSAV